MGFAFTNQLVGNLVRRLLYAFGIRVRLLQTAVSWLMFSVHLTKRSLVLGNTSSVLKKSVRALPVSVLPVCVWVDVC